ERMSFVEENEKKTYQVRTDLAVEAKDMYVENEQKETSDIKGIRTKERKENDIRITYVEIDEEGAASLGKKQGSYVTIYADGVKRQDTQSQENAAKILAKELEEILKKNKITKNATGLIVGLGNWNVTPDAL